MLFLTILQFAIYLVERATHWSLIRLVDIEVVPGEPYSFYVAYASGGIWKTVNNGTTFQPIFDAQGSYSIGCVTLDPSNPHVVWVGTGEDVGGRHVAPRGCVRRLVRGPHPRRAG